MAVRFDTAGDNLSRTTSLPALTLFTIVGWAKISVDTNDFANFFAHEKASNQYFLCGTTSDGTTFAIYNNLATVTGSALSVGTWNHAGIVVSGVGVNQVFGYLNGVLDITANGNSNLDIAGNLRFGANGDGNQFNGCLAAVKVYSAALTAAEIAQEMRQYLPVRTANLNSFYPLLSTADDEVDYSGAGLTLTVNGTLATEDGPPIPWKVGRHRVFIPGIGGGVTPGYVLVAN